MNVTVLARTTLLCAPALSLALGACSFDGDDPPPPDLATFEAALGGGGGGGGPPANPPGADPRFSTFESGQVRPLALSPDKKHLYAVNTPDDRLEVFAVKNAGLVHKASIPVGLEPVAVATRGDDEVWVVNHLSDSVSIIDVSLCGDDDDDAYDDLHVERTLLVGDEPRDIVFAGPQRRRAFVTTAHRGQNSPSDPASQTPGVGRADVWVFDAQNLGSALGGTPLTVVTLFADTPRALAVSPDGNRVYAAAFHSGNKTTVISEPFIPNGGEAAGGLPLPNTNFSGKTQAETSLIVKFRDGHWKDEIERTWDDFVMFSLPDKDVFTLDANANPPTAIASGTYTGVGTILFNMAVNPVSGKVYVANTESFNEVRFEGAGVHGGSSVRGHIAESRITVLSSAGVAPRHLNKHIDYDTCCAPTPNPESLRSLAFPMGMAVSSNGQKLYVAAFGSSKVGVYDTAALENDSFVPSTANQVVISGGGPSGVVLDEGRNRLYVMTRFDNGISVVNTNSKTEVAHLRLYNPEPASVVQGRRFLYDAAATSSHGDSACASCHVFGDFDSLSWDLGDPDAEEFPNLNPIIPLVGPFATPTSDQFKPMKGPMNTQSLRGMANHGPMHWRGDRTGSVSAPNAQPNSGAFDEQAAFRAFNVAFPGLLGRSAQLPAADMQAFTDFALQVQYPPNPIRHLDNGLTAQQQAGRDRFFQPQTTFGVFACNDCHVLDPLGNKALGEPLFGFFGSDGRTSFDASDDPIDGGLTPVKAPHLRNLYQKVGLFGTPGIELLGFKFRSTGFLGDQVRGFGNTHDGSIPLSFFLSGFVFTKLVSPNGFDAGFDPTDGAFVLTPSGQAQRDEVFAFLMAFDSNHAPVVGQQTTLTKSNGAVAGPRVTLFEARAAAGECELVAKGVKSGKARGWLYDNAGKWVTDRSGESKVSDATLRGYASSNGNELTFTCTPIGSGRRVAVDADLDGWLDGDERVAHTDPRNPASHP